LFAIVNENFFLQSFGKAEYQTIKQTILITINISRFQWTWWKNWIDYSFLIKKRLQGSEYYLSEISKPPYQVADINRTLGEYEIISPYNL